jgi:hypothetical protein
MTLVDSSRRTLPLQSAATPAPGEMEIARFVEAISGKDEFLYLPSAEKVIVPRGGTLAIDAMPAQ